MFNKINKLFSIILGLDCEWKKQWDKETKDGVSDLYTKRWHGSALTGSLQDPNEINRYKRKRSQLKKDEERKRLLEGLGVLPGWFALIISVLSLIISIFLKNPN